MEAAFYISAIIAVLATLGVVINTNPVHALLNLVISLIAVAMIFFALGAPFAGALEVIVYAGAIMVMFVFVIMMLNVGKDAVLQERRWMSPKAWRLPGIMSAVLLVTLVSMLVLHGNGQPLGNEIQGASKVGMALFGPYLILVELAAFLLLAALIIASHIGRPDATVAVEAEEDTDARADEQGEAS
ncbi:NADH-quinone oxidoreductase subunit J [Zymobacter sp. IVIA_12111.31 C1]|uniref:NADH-quinone oxidoreductase subunit J n=1 Tax=Zymobacter sp. IVIA_12111.31 C1 TaxID=3394854 RepID=UPI0039C2090D